MRRQAGDGDALAVVVGKPALLLSRAFVSAQTGGTIDRNIHLFSLKKMVIYCFDVTFMPFHTSQKSVIALN
jgi:hypothetical protein